MILLFFVGKTSTVCDMLKSIDGYYASSYNRNIVPTGGLVVEVIIKHSVLR